MWQQVQLVTLLVTSILCGAELPHLSVDEFRKQGGHHKYSHGQGGGGSGGVLTADASIGVTTSPNIMMLSSLELEPGLEQAMKQQRCVDPYRNIPLYGWRWFQSKLFYACYKQKRRMITSICQQE